MGGNDYWAIADLYLRGESIASLAKAHNINSGTLYRKLKQMGISLRGRSEAAVLRPKPGRKPSYEWVDKDGYVRVQAGNRNVAKHRLTMEGHIGRRLLPSEVVHHIDGDRKNNSIANLHLCRNASEHRQIHANELAEAACGNASWRKCLYCHTYDAPERLTHIASTQGSYHKACAAAYQRARHRSINNEKEITT